MNNSIRGMLGYAGLLQTMRQCRNSICLIDLTAAALATDGPLNPIMVY